MPTIEKSKRPTRRRKSKVTKVNHAPRAIKLLINYGGTLTGDQRIEPGDYYEDDPALFGLAKYLVEAQKCAIWIADVEYFVNDESESEVPGIDDLIEQGG